MKILVLGCGMQGRAVLHDLSKSSQVKEIICADINPEVISDFTRFLDMNKIKLQKLDVMDKKALISVMKDVDVVIDMLPIKFLKILAEAVLESKVNMVNSIYGHMMPKDIPCNRFLNEISNSK